MSLGIYVHLPFCHSICPYCDFYKLPYRTELESAFFDSLIRETELVADELQDRDISSVYIGGGTPSVVNPENIGMWFERLGRLFHIETGAEFTIECNPESADLSALERWQEIGVNRLVLGIQAFNQEALKLLGRRHTPDDIHRVIYSANAIGLTNIAVDFLFGLPGQRRNDLEIDIEQLIDLAPKHISLYQLTIESGTQLADDYTAGSIPKIDPDLVAAFYRGICQQLGEAGYRRYEVSSFALDGYECRHNLNYWRGGDYVGLGPSAQSVVDHEHIAVVSDVMEYMASLREGVRPLDPNVCDREQRVDDAIAMGLRMTHGIDRAEFSSRFGVPIEQRLNRYQYDLLVSSGYLVPDRGKLRLSDEGIDMADEITARLLG